MVNNNGSQEAHTAAALLMLWKPEGLYIADGEQPPPPPPPNRGLIEQHGSNMAMQDLDIWLGHIHALAPSKTNGHNQDEVNLPALLVKFVTIG